jgi:hypothetical protein
MDRDTRRALDEIILGAAAVGLCIARTLSQSDPKALQSFAEEADKMYRHLSAHSKTDAAQVVVNFSLALANPEKMPLLSPQESQ